MKRKHGKASFAAIPRKEHGRIRKLIALGYKGSPLTVWRKLNAHWKAQAAKQRAEQSEQLAKEQAKEQDAKRKTQEAAEAAIRKIAVLRDYLIDMEAGDSKASSAEDAAMFARAVLVEAGTDIEQILFDAGIVEGMKSSVRGRREGWMKEFLR